MSNVRHIFADRAKPKGHTWTEYERQIRDATAYAENGDLKSALASIGYASTLADKDRPIELERRRLFREFCAAANVWKDE